MPADGKQEKRSLAALLFPADAVVVDVLAVEENARLYHIFCLIS
jgi:hypothetical protein